MAFNKAALALALAAATCAPMHPAVAEAPPPACAPYPALVDTLRRQYGESLRLRAEDNRGFALEFFAHADGSWTLVMRQAERACAVAAGTAWRATDLPDGHF